MTLHVLSPTSPYLIIFTHTHTYNVNNMTQVICVTYQIIVSTSSTQNVKVGMMMKDFFFICCIEINNFPCNPFLSLLFFKIII
jgi:hypothetical protein